MNSLDNLITKSALIVVQHTQSNSNVEFWHTTPLLTAKSCLLLQKLRCFQNNGTNATTVQDANTVQEEKWHSHRKEQCVLKWSINEHIHIHLYTKSKASHFEDERAQKYALRKISNLQDLTKKFFSLQNTECLRHCSTVGAGWAFFPLKEAPSEKKL